MQWTALARGDPLERLFVGVDPDRHVDHFSICFTVAEYGSFADFLPFLVQSQNLVKCLMPRTYHSESTTFWEQCSGRPDLDQD